MTERTRVRHRSRAGPRSRQGPCGPYGGDPADADSSHTALPVIAELRAPSFLIADVAALTGVPPSRLRSWERAGLLHPGRASGGVRVYGVEDVARVRLIQRSLVNPGRRGSLRRLAARLASGELRPAPQDYAGIDASPAPATVAPSPSDRSGFLEASGAVGWRAVVDAVADLVAVCDGDGALVYANPALRAALGQEGGDRPPHTFFASGDLSLRWTARTGVPQQDVPVVLRRPDGTERHTRWHATPLRDADGAPRGAVGVGRDVTAERALATAEQERLAAAADDLRAPLTTVLGHLQLARRTLAAAARGATASPEGSSTARLARHLEVAEVGAHELLRSVGTLIDASAAAAGALVPRLDPGVVDLGELTQRAVEHARALTTRHAVTLQRPREPLVVAGDRARLRQVLDHLLANAVKYAPDGGPIDVRLVAAGPPPLAPTPPGGGDAPSWALLRVADVGLGIPAADAPRVFDRSGGASGTARLGRGTGLGLYACRAIVAAHGGHIWVERTAVATGSVGAAEGNEAGSGGWHGTVMALALPLAARPPAAGAEGDQGALAGPEEAR
jgi:PAS domain S-box-containing protein